jgi:bacterioferritin
MYANSIELLNKAVADELSAVHQYMYFHFQCDDQGYDLLAALFKRTAIEEMMHIEKIADRILYLKGDVELKADQEVQKIHDVKAMLELVSTMEQEAIKNYNSWAIECSSNADSVTRKLFEALVEDEERHYGQFDDEHENLQKFGESYLALQSIERSKNASSGMPPTQ